MRKKATWKEVVIAESDDLVNVEGNYSFPKDAVDPKYLKSSNTHTTCLW